MWFQPFYHYGKTVENKYDNGWCGNDKHILNRQQPCLMTKDKKTHCSMQMPLFLNTFVEIDQYLLRKKLKMIDNIIFRDICFGLIF